MWFCFKDEKCHWGQIAFDDVDWDDDDDVDDSNGSGDDGCGNGAVQFKMIWTVKEEICRRFKNKIMTLTAFWDSKE